MNLRFVNVQLIYLLLNCPNFSNACIILEIIAMTICWFGIYNPDFGRNKIYIQALRKAGCEVVECRDNSRGFIKYWRLWNKHRAIKGNYDVMVVGYPGHIVVPLAKLISKKKIIADLLGSLYDAEANSHYPNFWTKLKARFVDFMAIKFADIILLESEAQKKFFEKKFGESDKYKVMYTGVDEKFNQEFIKSDRKRKFMVLFRGKLTPESGIAHILRAAEMLKDNKNIFFRIIGSGYFLNQTERFLHQHNLPNLELTSQYLPDNELITIMKNADLILGQFEDNPRLDRSIPHKAFEALAMDIPYLTGEAAAVKEVVEDNVTAFLIPLADPVALAEKIRYLSIQPKLLEQLAARARKIFEEKFASKPLVKKLAKIVLQLSQ